MSTKTDLAEAIVVERTLDAPVARVWTALTNVTEMRQWYFDLKEFKPEIGFEFEFVVEHEGNTYHHLCKITEVIPQKRIAYTWRYKGEPGDYWDFYVGYGLLAILSRPDRGHSAVADRLACEDDAIAVRPIVLFSSPTSPTLVWFEYTFRWFHRLRLIF